MNAKIVKRGELDLREMPNFERIKLIQTHVLILSNMLYPRLV